MSATGANKKERRIDHRKAGNGMRCCSCRFLLLYVGILRDRRSDRRQKHFVPSGIHCHTVHVQGITVEGDVCRVSAEGRDIGVSGQRPGAGAVESHVNRADFGGNSIALRVYNLAADRAGECAAIGKIQSKAGVAAYEDRPGEFMPVGVECRDVAGSTPAVVTDGKTNY